MKADNLSEQILAAVLDALADIKAPKRTFD
jgi:hypothetical protein